MSEPVERDTLRDWLWVGGLALLIWLAFLGLLSIMHMLNT